MSLGPSSSMIKDSHPHGQIDSLGVQRSEARKVRRDWRREKKKSDVGKESDDHLQQLKFSSKCIKLFHHKDFPADILFKRMEENSKLEKRISPHFMHGL